MGGFVHLHFHSDYSLLDGACKLEQAFKRVQELGMDALALTDHGNMFGAIDFYTTAKEFDVKPIIGIEAYVAPGKLHEKKIITGIEDASYHLTLLAKDETGYKNLLRLSSIAYKEGFYYRPRVDKELLARYNKGIIALSGCPKSEYARACQSIDDIERAKQILTQLLDIFGRDNFFIEVQNHNLQDEKKIIQISQKLAKQLDLKLVATNDVHYIFKEDYIAHDVLLCINTGKLITDTDRLKFEGDQFYLKSPQEMQDAFSELPEALKTTLEIAEMCNLKIDFGKFHFPKFPVPEGKSPEQYLRELCYQGLKKRYTEVSEHIKQRLEYELSVIEDMGFVGYFLLVWDIVRQAREMKIPVGPGRGSAAGSLVAYVLEITDIDPIRYNLIFERFLNPSRKEMPDIDIDLCKERRAEIIEYIANKYGQENVAQIITFSVMKARQVIRDVGRVMGIEIKNIDKITKSIPWAPGFELSLEDAVKTASFQNTISTIKKKEDLSRLLNVAVKLEMLKRHASRHAAGIVIADKPIIEYLPLYVDPKDQQVMTQFAMDDLSKLGLLKIDLLGLEALTIIQKTIDLVNRHQNKQIDLKNIPLDLPEVYQTIQKGLVKGIFQLESSLGMKRIAQRMKIDKIEDLIALIALHRPGPLGGGMVEKFIRCKQKQESPEYMLKELEPILKETYGVVIYQEQVMQIANVVGGFSMAEADALRKAMGKKEPSTMARYKQKFVQGAVSRGIREDKAEALFDILKEFGGYGFNKSHAAAYSILCYQTAYLKTMFPVEFMTAVLSSQKMKLEKIGEYFAECKKLKIEILPPDINKSQVDFSVEEHNGTRAIRYSLSSIKGIGTKTAEEIVAARNQVGQFESLFHFCASVNLRAIAYDVIETLIKAGAFDFCNKEGKKLKRRQLLDALPKAIAWGRERHMQKESAQLTFFTASSSQSQPSLPDAEELPLEQLIADEANLLGEYFTLNPLKKYEKIIGLFAKNTLEEIPELVEQEVTIVGVIRNIKTQVIKHGSKRGEKFYQMLVVDKTGATCEAVMFEWDSRSSLKYLVENNVVVIKANAVERGEEFSLRIHGLISLEEAILEADYEMILTLRLNEQDMDNIKTITGRLYDTMKRHPGKLSVILRLMMPEETVFLKISEELAPAPSPEFIEELVKIIPPEDIRIQKRLSSKEVEVWQPT